MNTKIAAAAPAAALLNDKDMGLVGHVQVNLVAQLGNVELTLDRLFKLRQGDVLEMEQGLDAPVTLLLNGKAVARGELLAVDDQLGVRITELA
jgi:flagellar motor switch protein FliN/FliY